MKEASKVVVLITTATEEEAHNALFRPERKCYFTVYVPVAVKRS